jgi:deoxyribodipyrimidine photo-lyase
MKPTISIFWFRRDLRLEDNTGLYHALKTGIPLVPLFIFDKNILDELEDPADRRVEFIHQNLMRIQEQLLSLGSTMDVRHGSPTAVFKELLEEYDVQAVYTNNDYEPYAKERDKDVSIILKREGITLFSYKDQVIFEKAEVVKSDGNPYTVFTPYSRSWKAKLNESAVASYPTGKFFSSFYQQRAKSIPSLEKIGFRLTNELFPPGKLTKEIIKNYKEQRDYPANDGTSRLSVHLRFGTISIRMLVKEVKEISETLLNELIWREFYQMILWHFPHVVGNAFKPAYDKIVWRNNEREFEAWCNGQTGYPIVDAGMRELNSTGFMHNRVRMVTASFLTKHLLIDWRWGEAYFAKKLLDFDLASNNGGWQWAAGSGCDAAPYFRIFNPALQTKKFDPGMKYIRKWVPEVDELYYPSPIVEHEFARKRCLQVYTTALKK